MSKIIPLYVKNIVHDLCLQNIEAQKKGYGPFAAAVCDNEGNIISIAHNSVLIDNSSLCHAEVNAIRFAQEKLKTYNLSEMDLSICITAEPCSMCIGAIMWSGIKHIYYGVNSKVVEEITGFDEGYKPDWEEYFANKGISVIGNIEPEICTKTLTNYVDAGYVIYKPD